MELDLEEICLKFETIDQSRERLKTEGLIDTAHRIAKTWFVKEDKADHFDLCLKAGKLTSLKAADAALYEKLERT